MLPPGAPMPQGPAPMGGTGAASMPGAMKAEGVGGMAALKSAVDLIQKSLGELPLGSDVHTAALKAATELSKHIGSAHEDVTPNDKIQQLVAAARAAQGGGANPMAAMMPGGAPPGAGAPPPANPLAA